MKAPVERLSGLRWMIYADGACKGNPGTGGWAAVLRLMDGETVVDRVEVVGSVPEKTTNIKMEMTAAIKALQAIPPGDTAPITLRSDCEMLIKGMTEWLPGWMRRGWRTSAMKAVENRDRWEALVAASAGRTITWEHVRGHSGEPGNEEVNALAEAAARKAAGRC